MRRPLQIGALVVLALAAIAAVWVGWANVRGEEFADASAPAAATPEAIARGAYLARAGNCVSCHTERGGQPFAGGRAIETPFGTVYTSNITPHRTGLGDWSASDFRRALHNGRSKDGHLLYPAFPYPNYTLVTREDADAIYAFLRSLPPVDRANTPHRLRWPYNTQVALAVWRALSFEPGVFRPDAAQAPAWNRGAYLVQALGHCGACHSARNALGATSDMMDLSGGVIPMQNWYAPSLASKGEAGVAEWDASQVARLLRDGVAPRGTVLGPMAEVVLQSTQHLSADDLAAMATYLKSLPQHAAPQPSGQPMTARTAERGAKVYRDHCSQCHGERGEGVSGAYPALAGNRAVNLAVTANLVQVVLGGGFAPATSGNPRPFGMPPYANVLGDDDVAAVISYIRSSWGNRSGAIPESEVARQRGSISP